MSASSHPRLRDRSQLSVALPCRFRTRRPSNHGDFHGRWVLAPRARFHRATPPEACQHKVICNTHSTNLVLLVVRHYASHYERNAARTES